MEAKEINYNLLGKIIKEKKKKFIYSGVAVLGISLVLAFVLPKQYTSDATLQIKPQGQNISTNAALSALAGIGGNTDSYLEYMAIMKSRRVIDPVIRQLHNGDEENEKFTAEDFVKKYLKVDNPRGTGLLTMSITASSPEEAQEIAQNVVKSFQVALTDITGTQDSGMVKLLNKKIEDAKKQLDTDVAALEQYKQENGVFSPGEQEKAILEQSAGYEKAKAEAEVQLNTNSAIAANAEAELNQQNIKTVESQMADNPEIQEIRSKLLAANQNLASLQFKFTDTHPDVVKAKETVDYLQAQLSQTIGNAVGSGNVSLNSAQTALIQKRIVAESNVEAAKASIATLEGLSQSNINTANEFSQKSVKYFELERNVKIANETYAMLVKSTEDLKIKENMDSLDVRIVDAPNLPVKHSWPRKLYVVLAGFVVYIIGAGIFLTYRYQKSTNRLEKIETGKE